MSNAASPAQPQTKQAPEGPFIRILYDDSGRLGAGSNGATRSYTFGQLLADLKRNKPIRNGKVNSFDEHRLREECARKYATDITHESVAGLRDALCRKRALPPATIDALDAQAVIDLICDIKRLSLEEAIQGWQDAVA